MSRSTTVLAACLTVLALLLSGLNWLVRAYPARFWMEPPSVQVNGQERCPDGMCRQIELVADWMRGEPEAGPKLLRRIRTSPQSSTVLVGIACAPAVLLGMPPHFAFALLSALASSVLVWVFLRLARELYGGREVLCLVALAGLLSHPAALRCMVRPQTDALLACFTMLALYLGMRASRPERASPGVLFGLLPLVQFLALFVKIHALALLTIPVAVAFLQGLRGRRLVEVLVGGTLVPALGWCLVFQCLDMWPSIKSAWLFLDGFYDEWTAQYVLRNLAPTVLPLAVLAALCPGLRRGLPAALGLTVLGFGAIMAVCEIPPLMRFVYPMVAPLTLLATRAAGESRSRAAAVWLGLAVLVTASLSFGILSVGFYNRFIGPVGQLWWARSLYVFF